MAQGFAAIEIILVWLLLTGLAGIAVWKGNAPSGTALTGVLLLALSAVAALYALELLVHRHTPPYLWPIVTPALVPPLILAFCFWALLPSLQTLVCAAHCPDRHLGRRADPLHRDPADGVSARPRAGTANAERAKWSAAFASVTADAPLWDWTPFLSATDYRVVDDAVERIRHLPRRQEQAEAMLESRRLSVALPGGIRLDPTPGLCDKARALLRRSVPTATGGRPYAEIADAVDAAITAMEWLVGYGCACDAEAQAWEAMAQQYRDIGYDQYRLAALRDPKALGRRAAGIAPAVQHADAAVASEGLAALPPTRHRCASRRSPVHASSSIAPTMRWRC